MIQRFSGFELDDELFQLRRGTEVLELEPKAYDVLVHLIEHRDRVVLKDELLAEVWSGQIISESVLPTHIRSLRRAFGDARSEQRFIQTVYGRGYRFVAALYYETASSAHAST